MSNGILAWTYLISPFSDPTSYLSANNDIVEVQSSATAWNLSSSGNWATIVLANCSAQPLYLAVSGSQVVVSPNPSGWFLWPTNPGYYLIAEPNSSNDMGFSNGTVTLQNTSSSGSAGGAVADPNLFWQLTQHPDDYQNMYNPGCPQGYTDSDDQR